MHSVFRPLVRAPRHSAERQLAQATYNITILDAECCCTVSLCRVSRFIVVLNAECRVFIVMLSVIMLSAIMLRVIKLSVIMLSVIMLSVIMLSVILLRVAAPLLKL